MRSIHFVVVGLLGSVLLPSVQCQVDEPYVEEDDALDAALAASPKKEPEPKYPDGVNTIPGQAERDYPTYSRIVKTSFSCFDHPAGFYADVEARCQIWHICDTNHHQQDFLCSNGTLYSQASRVCDWWYNVNCNEDYVSKNFEVNADLFQIPESAKNYNADNDYGNGNGQSEAAAERFPVKASVQVQRERENEADRFKSQSSNGLRENQNQKLRDYTPAQNYQNEKPRYVAPAPTPAPANYNNQNQRAAPSSRNSAPREIIHPGTLTDPAKIAEILARQEKEFAGLSEDEKFPLKAKLRRQREMEAERIRKAEEAKRGGQPQAQPQRPTPPPQPQYQPQPQSQYQKPNIRVVEAEPHQKPAIIRLSHQIGVNPPRSPVHAPNFPTTTTAAPYRPTTTYAPYRPPTTTPAPYRPPTTTPAPYRPPTTTYAPYRPPTTTPAPYRPSTSERTLYTGPKDDNWVRPPPKEERRQDFEGTDESKFPQQQARQFPSSSSGRPIRIEDPPINSQDEERRNNNRFQNSEPKAQQNQQRFQNDVNADGNRFQNGESRQNRPQRPSQQESRPEQERRPQPQQERPRPQNFDDRGQPQSQSRPSQQVRNYRTEENERPQPQPQSQRRPDNRRPVPVPEEREIPETRSRQRERDPEPPTPQRNAVVREPERKPSPAIYEGPDESHAQTNSYRQRFRHSTPRRHNVQFAPPSRVRELEAESQISEETQQPPVPSVYNNRFFQQSQPFSYRRDVPYKAPESAPEPKVTTTTTQRPTPAPRVAVATSTTQPKTYNSRPTPQPETIRPIKTTVPKNKPKTNLSPTIVRIIVKQNPTYEPEQYRQPPRTERPYVAPTPAPVNYYNNQYQNQRPRDYSTTTTPAPTPRPAPVSRNSAPREIIHPGTLTDPTKIAEILARQEKEFAGLTEDEKFPLKAKLRRQREMEAERIRKAEEAKRPTKNLPAREIIHPGTLTDKAKIAEIFARQEKEFAGLSEDERYPLKAKLRRQREMEAERIRKAEEVKRRGQPSKTTTTEEYFDRNENYSRDVAGGFGGRYRS